MGMLGALIGAAIDRRDGDSGLKGAVLGGTASRAAKTAVPLAATFAIGWAVKKLMGKAMRRASDRRHAR
ncbi:MAG: hypothetical protein ACRCY3_16535 [Sphingorhabdus sp.]